MITMGTNKVYPEWGYPYALAIASNGTTGFYVGGFVKTKRDGQEYMCEITEMSEKQVQLIGLGWTDKESCYVDIPSK